MTKAFTATVLAIGLALSASACDHTKGTASPEKKVSTTEATTGGVTTSRDVKVLSETHDTRKSTIDFTAERGRTKIRYKLSKEGHITILVVGPDGNVVDSIDDRASGDGTLSLQLAAPGDYVLEVRNPKRVPYRISVSQHIVG